MDSGDNSQARKRLLRIENLKIQFRTRDGLKTAVDGIDLEINYGEIVGLVGESGCGKSVTSLSILKLLPEKIATVSQGKILFNDDNILSFDDLAMRKIRGDRISMIFQEPMTSLNPVYTVGDQVSEILYEHMGKHSGSKAEFKGRVIEMFHHMGISMPESRYNAYPHQLSGGLRQRIMIAMALICKPDLLIADEPTTALDVTIQAQILDLMKKLRMDFGTSILLITHDLGVVAEFVERVYIMYAGKIVETGTVEDIFAHAYHPYTEGLIRSVPKIEEKVARMDSIPGVVPSINNIPKGCRFHPRCQYVKEICKKQEPELLATGNQSVRCHKYAEYWPSQT
jgi:oligopeptide/dipeptide ABC transporter ATP-binding protein